MPLENRFLDPSFSLRSAVSWEATDAAGDAIPVRRQAFSVTPTQQPVLSVEKDGSGGFVVLAGLTRLGQGPLEASVSIGRVAAQPDFDHLHVVVTGYSPAAGSDMSLDLLPTTDVELEGIIWRRYEAATDEGFLGWGILLVIDESPATLYLTGPVVVRSSSSRLRMLRPPVRVASSLERSALKRKMQNLLAPDPRAARAYSPYFDR